MRLLSRIFGGKSPHEQLFFRNEFVTLAGKKNSVLFALFGILSITFIAIGFASGGVDNLEEKMSNPFTSWIMTPTGNVWLDSENVESVLKTFNSPESKQAYHLNYAKKMADFNVKLFRGTQAPSQINKESLKNTFFGRVVNFDDEMFQAIADVDNRYSKQFKVAQPGECLSYFKEETLRKLGYSNLEEGIETIVLEVKNELIAIPVAGVVKSLPGSYAFVCNPELFNVITRSREKQCANLLASNNDNNKTFRVLTNSNLDRFEIMLNSAFSNSEIDVLVADLEYKTSPHTILELRFSKDSAPTLDSIKSLQEAQLGKAQSFVLITTFECPEDNCQEVSDQAAQGIVFNFEKTDKIREFSSALDAKNIRLDMKDVESMLNFSLVSNLTLALSLILFVFSLLSILLYVNNQLKNHLMSIKQNLGTFKAFGLSNKYLIKLYLRIILAFLIIAMLAALCIAFAVEIGEDALYGRESKFNLFTYWMLGAIGLLITFSIGICYISTRRVLSDTPGNLIYNR